MTAIRTLVAALAALVVVALAPALASAAPAVDGEFDLGGDQPGHLTLGADGNVWVAIGGVNDVAKVTPDGTITKYDPPNVTNPVGITAGPDGNLWVTQSGEVAKFSPADPVGTSQKFTVAAITDPRRITSGPDGNLWTASGDKVIKITTVGVATPFTIAGLGARGIAKGSDGRLYVADFGGARIISVDTSGVLQKQYPTGGGPQEVVGGAGNQVAYANPGGSPETVGRIDTPDGTPQTTDTPLKDPFGITLGADGAYWIAEFAGNALARLTTDGQLTTLTGFGASSGPRWVTTGANNTLWVSEETSKKIARVSGVEPPPPPPTPPTGGGETPGGGGTTTPPADTTAPIISALSVAPNAFVVGSKDTALVGARTPRGTRIRFLLSEAAAVTLRFERAAAGRRVGTACVRPTAKLRRAKRCTRYLAAGALRRTGRAGANQFTFTGRVGTRPLTPGRYRLTVSAKDAAGNAARPQTARFTVLPPKKKS